MCLRLRREAETQTGRRHTGRWSRDTVSTSSYARCDMVCITFIIKVFYWNFWWYNSLWAAWITILPRALFWVRRGLLICMKFKSCSCQVCAEVRWTLQESHTWFERCVLVFCSAFSMQLHELVMREWASLASDGSTLQRASLWLPFLFCLPLRQLPPPGSPTVTQSQDPRL